jgi:hypothetical protein
LRLLLQSFWASIALNFSNVFLLLLLHIHYMFRPLRAIFRWNIYTGYFTRSYFSTADPLFLFLVINCIYILVFLRFFVAVSNYMVDMIVIVILINLM